MAKVIGNLPHQVPTNGDLGTMAFEDNQNYVGTGDIGATVQAYDADIPTVAASQAEMEAGTEVAVRSMSPLGVAQAIAALESDGLGVNQTWQSLTGSRVSGVTYTNTTGRTICAFAQGTLVSGNNTVTGTVDGVLTSYLRYAGGAEDHVLSAYLIIPNGSTYAIDLSGGVSSWSELR